MRKNPFKELEFCSDRYVPRDRIIITNVPVEDSF
jgi:hypothetical protein